MDIQLGPQIGLAYSSIGQFNKYLRLQKFRRLTNTLLAFPETVDVIMKLQREGSNPNAN